MNETNLHNYQKVSAQYIVDNPFYALFLDMGLGKTVATLTAIQELMYDRFEVGKALIIAPKRVARSVWSSEIEKWDHLNHLTYSKVQGTERQRRQALDTKADIYLLGRDNVSWLCSEYGGLKLPFDMLVIDESSSFKSHSSQRFKTLKKVLPSFDRAVLLTGTPTPNSLIDLWSQIYILDKGERFTKFITRYREAYFRRKYDGFGYSLLPGAEEQIKDKIKDICVSMKAKDYLDLPGRVDNYIPIQFSSTLQLKYDKFEEEKVLELISSQEGKTQIPAMNAAALTNKLQQFANGAIYDVEKNYHVVHDLKIEAAEDIVDTANGKPVLIAWTFRHDMYRLMDALKKHKPRELKTEQDEKDWNSGKVKVMLMHPASGGHGLNLQSGGNIIIWFGQTWQLELLQQFNARLDRQGQTEVTIINYLVAHKTVDQRIIEAQERKDEGQTGIMNAVKHLIRKYS